MADTYPTEATLDSTQITVEVDWLDREVILVPDEVALRIEAERKNGWQEFLGFAWGQSRPFPPGTWMHQVLTTLMAAYAASPISEKLTGRDRESAVGHRALAQVGWELRLRIAGASDWNPETRGWRDFPRTRDMHPLGWAGTDDTDGGAYQICG